MKNSYPGVRAKEHPTHFRGKKDIYFSIRYTINGKQYEEGIGWKSQGFTAEKAYQILGKLKQDLQAGGAVSLKDQREQAQRKEKANAEALKQKEMKDISFSELFERYYTPYIKNKNRVSTYEREISLFEKWLEPSFGALQLSRICRNSLISILNKMKKANLSNRTQNYAIALTRQVFNYAISEEIFSGNNPASKFNFKKQDNSRARFLTNEELNNLLDELKQRSFTVYLMALISADCGLRAGEIFKLTWADINLENKTLFLRDTKNGKNRYAYMTKRVCYEISKLKQAEGNHLLFPNRNRERVGHISRTFERAVKKLELNKNIADRRQKIVFHSLRHTYASRLVQKGVSLYEVKELLGHSDIKMTMRYSHLTNNTLRQAVATLDE